MPRLQLSDAEAKHILALRAKNAEVRGFNDGIDMAKAMTEAWFNANYLADEIPVEKRVELWAALNGAKKPELLS